MEPLAALSLASNVVQFVTFAKDLISTSIEIRESTSGCTANVLTLDSVYGRLSDLSENLKSCTEKSIAKGADISKNVAAIKQVSQSCKADCDKLLGITERLKAKARVRHWQSFRIALRMFLEQSEIAQLQDRLNKSQVTLTLHICTVTSYWHRESAREHEVLLSESRRLQLEQSAKLDQIADELKQLNTRTTRARSRPSDNPFEASDMDFLQSQMERLSFSHKDLAKEQAILESLSFERRPVRHPSIPDAHRTTFEWVFEVEDTTADTTNLTRWLRDDDSIFWVSGNPGSGKSTLMKFIADGSRTYSLLSEWSLPKGVIIASHYFWNAGTPMQKSQQGLFQTLLYEIFRQCPGLIADVCGSRWTDNSPTPPPWSFSELKEAFEVISGRETGDIKICFFIDGLDEYIGDHVELCISLKSLAKSPHIKLCVSSRPWNAFEEAFGQGTKLYVQDLTRNDIRRYVQSRIYEHPRWTLVRKHTSQDTWLINEIAERACGVFLWVFLVTKQLRNGLTNRDSFSDLCRRLESFPSELEDFFKKILESVESFYHNKMSTTLQITIAAAEPLSWFVYHFHDLEYDSEDYFLNVPEQPFKKPEISELMEETK